VNYFQAIIIAIVEGLTEFLPVSSTGHMIVTTSLMGISSAEFTRLYIVVIQLGAILAVVIYYWKRFFNLRDIKFYLKLLVGFIPIVIFGLLFKKKVDMLLDRVDIVAWALLLGGIFLLFVDRIFKEEKIKSQEKISYLDALVVGFFQCIALVPGVSRAAATITGGLYRKFDKSTAAEFSFFIAVPTMFAATVKDLWDFQKAGFHFGLDEIKLLIAGNLVAFVVAFLTLRYAMNFIVKYGFRSFGIYRIIIGASILILLGMGYKLEII
jgi:undecaprenyl-diphosphatase